MASKKKNHKPATRQLKKSVAAKRTPKQIPAIWAKAMREVVAAHLDDQLQALVLPLRRLPTRFEAAAFDAQIQQNKREMTSHLRSILKHAQNAYEQIHGDGPCSEGDKCIGRHITLVSCAVATTDASEQVKKEMLVESQGIVSRYLQREQN
jgi:hypothetical protein